MFDRGMVGRSFFKNTNFINVFYSTVLCVYEYFKTNIFPDDPSRIIYSTNDFAFRKRIQLNSSDKVEALNIQGLNLPFMNFSISSGGISERTDRTWKSTPLEFFGAMDWTIGKKIKMTPVKISFESTFFSDKEIDIQYVMNLLSWDNALETVIKPKLTIDNQEFSNIGIMSGYSLQYRSRYNESDWLERNNIRVIGMDFEVDTFLLETDTSQFWIPKEVLLSFATDQNLDTHEWDNYDLLLTGVIDHIEKDVVF